MRRDRFIRRSGVVLLVVGLFFVTPLLSQRITGDISGNVTDSSGAVVPGATVTATNPGTGASRTGISSSDGNFRLPELSIGTFRVSVSAEGFKTIVQNVDVLAGAVVQANFKLSVGQRSETVEVEGAAPLVELSLTTTTMSTMKRSKAFL